MFEIHKDNKRTFRVTRLLLIAILSFWLTMGSAFAGPDNTTDTREFSNTADFATPRISLDYHLDLPEYNILDHIIWDPWRDVPGAYRLEIVGIHKSIISQVSRRIRQQAEDDLRREWNLSNMSGSTFRYRMGQINTEHNPYGEWWQRSWFHSLPPEKGGAPREQFIDRVGWEIEITDRTPLIGWFKQQFDKLGDIWISADHEFDETRGNNPQRNDGRVDNNPKDMNRIRVREANLGIDRPWRWFESDNYHLRFRPIVKFSSDVNAGFFEEVALRIQAELFTNHRTQQFGTLSFFVRHDFQDQNTFFSVFLEVVTW